MKKTEHNGLAERALLFFRENPPSVNVFLFLFLFCYFTVGIDLGKEIATKKDEIGFFTASLSNSVHADSSEILSLLERVPPENGLLPPIIYVVTETDVELFPPARSPPSM